MLIGVIPASKNLNHPADRRRCIYCFKKKGFEYELADYEKCYDAVYITIKADLGLWSTYKKKWKSDRKPPKVIFDICDDLLSENQFVDALRSLYYYFSRRTSTFSLSYKRIVRDMIANSDVVVCGSAEQKSRLDPYHPNVHVIRDYFLDDIAVIKTCYELRRPTELNILWEGFSHGNIRCFEMLRDILTDVSGYDIHLHVITDPSYCRIGGSVNCSATFTVLEKVFAGSLIKLHLYDWNDLTFSAIAASCDFALIPIPQDNQMMMKKPENKLLLLWSIGLPTIATNTGSYSRVMQAIGHHYVASSVSEWKEKIQLLASDGDIREQYVKSAKIYLNDHCSESSILASWDEVFQLN